MINERVNWSKIVKVGNRGVDLCLSVIYKYRCIEPKPIKSINLSPFLYDAFIVWLKNKKQHGISVWNGVDIPTIDNVEIYRGNNVKWEYECKFHPEVKADFKEGNMIERSLSQLEHAKDDIHPDLEKMYKNGDIKTKIEIEK